MPGNVNSGRLKKGDKIVSSNEGKNKFTHLCPKDLPKVAKDYWRELVPILKDMGVLGDKDIFALRRLCILKALWEEAAEFVLREGATVEKFTKYGAEDVERIQVKHMRQYAGEIRDLEHKFGLTPKSSDGIKGFEGNKERKSVRDKY